MRKTAPLLLLGFALLSIKTQAQQFVQGTNVVSAGVGLGSSILSYSGATQTPGISLQYERGVWNTGGPGVISLGGYAGFKGYKFAGKYGTYSYDEKWNYTVIGIRSAYHYNGLKAEKVDLYGGLMLSYNILSFKYSDNSPYGNAYNAGSYGSTVGFSFYLGGRYFFTDHFAAMAELGYGVAYLNLGVALKF